MRTDGAIITNAGLELISYAIANNKNITFTKTKLGKGDVNTFDEAKKLTDVVSFYKQISITSISRNNSGIIRIRSTFTNEDFPIEVVLKEVGIFATVEGKSETLFAYVNDGAGENFPPGTSGNIVERVRDIYVGVSTAIEVNAIIDRSTVYATIFDLEEGLNKKENKIDKKNGFNLEKTDLTENDSNKLFSAKGALNLFNNLTTNFTNAINTAKEALRVDIVKKVAKDGDTMTGPLDAPILTAETYFKLKDYYTHTLTAEFWFNKDNPNYSPETLYIDGIKDILVGRNRVYHQGFKPTPVAIGAEPSFNKKGAFNKDFGVGQNEVLEGSKLAEILGIEYGGILNNINTKVAGKGYYDTANKKIYKCTTNTSINYADAGYFVEVSNNDLLGKLQNLYNVRDLNIIDLDSKTLLVSANVSVKNGELKDFSQNYGFCQKYLAFNISNIIPIPKSVHLLGCFCGVRDKTQLGWISGSGSTFSYKNGVIHLYLTNPTAQYDWSDQSVSFSLIAKY